MNLIISLDSLCKITENMVWASGQQKRIGHVTHASDCCRLCQEDPQCVHFSFSMGSSLYGSYKEPCILQWPTCTTCNSGMITNPRYLAGEATGCSCGKVNCFIDVSLVVNIISITLCLSCKPYCLATLILDYCDPNPCQNGGTCLNTGSGFTCNCASNWSGTRCQNTGEFLNQNRIVHS